MDFYLAPMEGVTGYIFRNAVHEYFGEGLVKYFTPFIAPRPKSGMQKKERRDLLPENNRGIRLVPQILTARADDFLSLSEEIYAQFGWEEINLNAGCPSGTVVKHGKGSGLLRDTEALDRLLDGIFSKTDRRVSVKTRLGMEDPEEFAAILEVYNRYPMTELIIHPRVREDQYKHPVRMEYFLHALDSCGMPVVYNGDIYTEEDYREKMAQIGADRIRAVMLGRGLMRDPALARTLSRSTLPQQTDGNGDAGGTGTGAGRSELRRFHDRIFEAYREIFDGEMPLLFHMKELWGSMGLLFPEEEKALKKIRKSSDAAEYLAGVREILW